MPAEVWRVAPGVEIWMCSHLETWIDPESGNMHSKYVVHQIEKPGDCTTPEDETPNAER
jgi:hypothetical protein